MFVCESPVGAGGGGVVYLRSLAGRLRWLDWKRGRSNEPGGDGEGIRAAFLLYEAFFLCLLVVVVRSASPWADLGAIVLLLPMGFGVIGAGVFATTKSENIRALRLVSVAALLSVVTMVVATALMEQRC